MTKILALLCACVAFGALAFGLAYHMAKGRLLQPSAWAYTVAVSLGIWAIVLYAAGRS